MPCRPQTARVGFREDISRLKAFDGMLSVPWVRRRTREGAGRQRERRDALCLGAWLSCITLLCEPWPPAAEPSDPTQASRELGCRPSRFRRLD